MDQNFKVVQVESSRDELVATASNFLIARAEIDPELVEKAAERIEARDLQRAKRHHRRQAEAKKLRYASDFFSGLFADRKDRKRQKAFVAGLGDLQVCLGDLNDIQTGHEIAADLARPEAAPAQLDGRSARHRC